MFPMSEVCMCASAHSVLNGVKQRLLDDRGSVDYHYRRQYCNISLPSFHRDLKRLQNTLLTKYKHNLLSF